ncbi:type VI secretion system protein [Acinetobacter sp. ANC 4558]|uniref:type VI secretion system Vgr family protein n=1 Tax=Acinetobacter sp. ANC 4558 TaxID=1977876 RepID=UPI000A3494B2|nr:type VI secretion system Vgr family protein [Acinetobacter sp. ANC 4558]OTG88318.1 type VI secretion system protein [Acinetobacter sp. ANC 4558]
MITNIFAILDKIGLGTQRRALHVQFSNSELNHQVLLQRIDGQHAINEGLSVELICLSSNPYLSLKQFIGSQVAVDQVTDSGQLFRTTGIITEAVQGQSDGALTIYRLTMQDATSLWHKRRNSRVFMNKSAIEIVEIIFKEWQEKSPLFAASLQLDLTGLQHHYDIRPFSMQSNESDYAYISRLLRESGVSWLIDESNAIVASQNQTIEAQKLRLIDDNAQFSPLSRRTIRYHRSHATEQTDSITSFIAQRQLQPTAIHVQRWQADALAQEEGAGSVLSSHQHSSQQGNESLSLEQAWNISPAWISDLKGEDQATKSSNAQIEKLNTQLNQYQTLQSKYFTAHGSVRDVQVGYWFQLNGHPELDQNHRGSDQEFLILSKHFYNQNNLPKDVQEQLEKLLQQSHWTRSKDSTEERQANELTVIRRSIDVVPEYDPQQYRPTAYVQRAKVVGIDGEEIHVDEWGRIKVRFLFTRNEDHTHDGGAGSNDNDTDSAWVDVLTPWAGEGYGARFLPRVGEIVVIDFFDGNIDRPFVTGRIHEAHRHPTKFDIKGQLPDTKKLSGIRSKEVAGEGFNQLRFDDTTGQISAQLHSSHGTTQLNLGNLSHPKEQAQSDGRGEGFELRTDQWGAVRAGDGLLISTHRQDSAEGTHLDANQASSQLESNLNQAKALSEVAKNQQTDPLEALDELKNFIDQIEQQDEKKAAAFKQALMIIAAPNSIAVSSHEDIHLSADRQISQSAGDSINLSTQKSLIAHAQNKISLFAAQDGFRAYAAKGKAEIQAQTDGIDVFARKGIQIISREDTIEIIAKKKIVLKGGESQLVIEGGGIFPTTAKLFESKAGQHVFKGGEKVAMSINALPQPICIECFIKAAKEGSGILRR